MVAKLKSAGEAAKGTSQKRAKTVSPKRGGKAPSKLAASKKVSSKKRTPSPKVPARGTRKKASDKLGTKSTTSAPLKKKIRAGKQSAATGSRKTTSAKSGSAKKGDAQAIDDFKNLVNVTRKRLESWLDTDESKKVGLKYRGKGESAGNESGKKIVELIGKRRDRFSDDDLKHIHKVVDSIKRHLAQRPKGDITASNWRYSLMNWGHDPAK